MLTSDDGSRVLPALGLTGLANGFLHLDDWRKLIAGDPGRHGVSPVTSDGHAGIGFFTIIMKAFTLHVCLA